MISIYFSARQEKVLRNEYTFTLLVYCALMPGPKPIGSTKPCMLSASMKRGGANALTNKHQPPMVFHVNNIYFNNPTLLIAQYSYAQLSNPRLLMRLAGIVSSKKWFQLYFKD